MNLPIINSVAILLMAIPIVVSGQAPPKSELVSEFGRLPCGHIHAQTDVFAEEIKQAPGSRAVILLSPPDARPEEAARYRMRISRFLQLRGLTTDRFSFYKCNKSSDNQVTTQFWKVPPDAALPFADAALWNEAPHDTSRAFLFGFEDEINICPTFVPAAFAKIIHDNPGSFGRVIVEIGRNPAEYPSYFAARLIKELVEEHDVPRKRLRLIFRKGTQMTAAEFWFVPAKKK